MFRNPLIALLMLLSLSACNQLINKLAFFPDSNNVIASEQLPPPVQELQITTEDGIQLRSLFLPTSGSNKLVIYFHGNAGNVYHRIPALTQLQQAGINVIGASYRGYGKSEGAPSEAGIYKDADATLRYAQETLGFKEENIILFGRSIGTTATVHIAQHKKLAGIILVTPLTSAKEKAKNDGIMWLLSPLAGDAFDNASKVKNIVAPTLVLHGTHDNVIPYTMGEEIFQRLNSVKRFIRIEGAGHNNLSTRYAANYWPPIMEFIQQR